MRLQHGVTQQLRKLSRRYPLLYRASIATYLLTVLWLYTIKWGERAVYEKHVDACHWESWEEWPRDATPHHLVLIADPQLVDPHTYPGRPWPLSALTERYTDLYMARNFRLINDIIDPDTIIFLGDLFDGGREWAPEKAKELSYSQRVRLQELGVLPPEDPFGRGLRSERQPGKEFVHGENGRWGKWGNDQWLKDFRRFGKIFFEPDQLYPYQGRKVFPAYDVSPDNVSIQNGAENVTWQEYATMGGKQRQVITSLPGNHDVGFAAGVQVVIRDRFQSHFGESNRIDVIGNHTFISLDTPSLAAHSFFRNDGWESDREKDQLKHIWTPTMDFLNGMQGPATKAVTEALESYYPKQTMAHRWRHEVTEPSELVVQAPNDELAGETAKQKPKLPVVLLSHVPLFRPRDTECGSLRENSKAIAVHVGYQYQNVLTQTLSKNIVSKVSEAVGDIEAAFSGDDHDYCDVTHRFNVETKLRHVREITVKSFSWAMGVRRPGFLLVSLWNPVDGEGNTIGTPLPSVQTKLCLLPDQLKVFIDYGLLLAVTVGILALDAIYSSWRGREPVEIDDDLESPLPQMRMALPRFRPSMNGPTNVYTAKAAASKPRQRGTSTSTSSHSRNNSAYTGVQRNLNARTRDITSPGGPSLQYGGPLIERAGYFPQVRWTDPGEDSDEEERLGVKPDWKEDDSQAKWKWRRRPGVPDKLRRPLKEFGIKVLLVGIPAGLYYSFLVRKG